MYDVRDLDRVGKNHTTGHVRKLQRYAARRFGTVLTKMGDDAGKIFSVLVF